MPMIDIIVEEGALDKEAMKIMPNKVANLCLEAERLSGVKRAEELTWIYIHESPGSMVLQASGKPSKPLYRIHVTTIKGLLDKTRKQSLGSDLAKLFYALEGSAWNEEEARNRVWTLFFDKEEGDWLDGDMPFLLSHAEELRKAALK